LKFKFLIKCSWPKTKWHDKLMVMNFLSLYTCFLAIDMKPYLHYFSSLHQLDFIWAWITQLHHIQLWILFAHKNYKKINPKFYYFTKYETNKLKNYFCEQIILIVILFEMMRFYYFSSSSFNALFILSLLKIIYSQIFKTKRRCKITYLNVELIIQ